MAVANQAATTVVLKISCTNLRRMDLLSESDPMVVVSRLTNVGNEKLFKEIGRTETVKNCPDPDFKHLIKTEYHFEQYQKLRFDVYDIDSDSRDLSKHDFIGYVECSLGSLVGEKKGLLTEPLVGKTRGDIGNIRVVAEELRTTKDRLVFKPRAVDLDRKSFFFQTDPYVKIHRSNVDGSFSLIYQTEVAYRTSRPCWMQVSVPLDVLCNNDHDRVIRFECYSWSWISNHKLIGIHECSLRKLLDQKLSPSLDLIHPKKQKNAGRLELHDLQIVQDYSFLDYLSQGLEMNFVVAIDFTSSNGDPKQPNSLHYIGNPNQPNQYQQAIWAVGSILEDYDHDKLFPSYGFGASVCPLQPVSHIFNLNLQTSPVCSGVQGVLQAYLHAVLNVQLSGPTHFAPIINAVADLALSQHQQWGARDVSAKYYTLLLITDGEICDIETTKAAIVRASSLPMSIIIVGVGSASFDAMEELDSDNVVMHAKGVRAERDIVQFVPFRDFVLLGSAALERLAAVVLEELPEQVTSYMRSNAQRLGRNVNATSSQRCTAERNY